MPALNALPGTSRLRGPVQQTEAYSLLGPHHGRRHDSDDLPSEFVLQIGTSPLDRGRACAAHAHVRSAHRSAAL